MITLKINNVPGYPSGHTLKIATDKNKIPIDRFWRNRLRDAERDQCVEIATSKPAKSPKGDK